ncbi:MAG: serine/threonine protein kinase, partial [Planctomycetota bacterium]
MTDDRWARIKSVVADAMDRPAAERAAFIEGTCGEDPELRAAVLELLDHDEKADAYFHGTSASGVNQRDTTAIAGRIGRYEIRRVIASGGVGTVYEAVQDHPRRLVAIKVLSRSAASPNVLKRFQVEAEILGRLRHPNIAQIHDAGTFDEDEGTRPYFAMELVRGEPMIVYADSKRLVTRERLELFVKVCDAVQYAHDSGVIHRDLKPDNILVDQFGEPKILDFGVARITGCDIQVTTLRTDIGLLIGTVPYMSPEQATGDPSELDTRSDVYSLGVVLYELMCGQLPYDLKGKNIPEAVRVIREDNPTPLSSINRTWRGDLGTIVNKALEKEKDRRYQHAAELAADIRHFLRDEPIIARPASTFYQLRKFARRNRALVTGATVAAVALVLGTIVSVWKAAEAQSEATKALAVKEFLGGVIGATDFIEAGQSLTVVDVLDRAVLRIESAFPDQPETQAEIRHLLGLSYASMSEFDRSLVELRAALNTRRHSLGPAHPDTLESAHDLGRVLWQAKQLEEAEDILRDVVAQRQRTLGENHP